MTGGTQVSQVVGEAVEDGEQVGERRSRQRNTTNPSLRAETQGWKELSCSELRTDVEKPELLKLIRCR